ncbi:MAG TPA: nitrite reductase small subunit NirD [Cycloclasticus sp.]|jgi:nitrite reductase (NADH) small subunit|nr:nitrite reductase small subunit NirD [Cycloclasticus sp.]HIL94217.1 nitrite reductase small subunit NirD [Cycloclasticus sp.]
MQTAQQENITWHDICAISEIPKDAGVAALVEGQQIALFSIAKTSQVFAIANYDPFSEANVLARGIIGSIGEALVVASPIYKQHFDLTTGQCLEDETVAVESYPVRIDNDRVYIGLTV